jgi:hypothetical protein
MIENVQETGQFEDICMDESIILQGVFKNKMVGRKLNFFGSELG